MAEKKDAEIGDRAIELAKQIFDKLWDDRGTHDTWHWIILVGLVVVAVFLTALLAMKALGATAEGLIKLLEAYKSSGLPLWQNKESRARIRKRQQFSAVLDADLAYLAKAESWNDQYFTDLEAEVETEGSYYASTLDRLRGKKSSGLRKERSLMRAISSSTERAMQLIGEPGSGKSVALRHLAKQFAETGKKSNDDCAVVPLYVNLREIEIRGSGEITVDAIRRFILDNIRRGDVDTSNFVRENWEDYCTRGIWLFLFDSFDEIPAVLHAEAGSGIIKTYSSAIRQFLEGMGSCKGILASREFKGPEALPWKKLRILPLSGLKQDELIANSFLELEQMSIVRHHLAQSDGSIGATPLFLTLLCRYVREEKRAPTNDHDILMLHIERLASRDIEYLKRKYRITARQLLDGAERLAQLFAEDTALSLAPTLAQIEARLHGERVPGGPVERLISALVDCKIGRNDVPGAMPGDRRFAFAHRRYQEALFVRYLSRHPDAISPRALLTEPRWREYAVTLLQTQSTSETYHLLEAAQVILQGSAENQEVFYASPPLPSSISYFGWHSNQAVPLLNLLQEGLSRRREEIPDGLTRAIANFLMPRWLRGDTVDRYHVLRLGGLLPQHDLANCLSEAFASGTRAERAQAFRQTVFASQLPQHAREAVMHTLATQILRANSRESRLRMEALAARLPSAFGARFVVERCNRLRNSLSWMNRIARALQFGFIISTMNLAFSFFEGGRPTPNATIRRLTSELGIAFPIFLLLPAWISCFAAFDDLSMAARLAGWTILLIVTSLYLRIVSQFVIRARGEKIGFFKYLTEGYRFVTRPQSLLTLVFLIILVIVLFAIVVAFGYVTRWAMVELIGIHLEIGDSDFWNRAKLGTITSVVAFYSAMSFLGLQRSRRRRLEASKRRLRFEREKSLHKEDVAILLQATDRQELNAWLSENEKLLSDSIAIREFSAFICQAENSVGTPLHRCIGASDGAEITAVGTRTLRQLLENRLEVWEAQIKIHAA